MRIGILFPSIYASLKLFPDKIFAPRELCIDLINGLVAKGHEVTVYGVPDLPANAHVISESLDYIKNPFAYYKFRGVEDSKRKSIESEFAKHTFEVRLISKCFEDAKNGKLDVIHVYHESSMFLSHYFQEVVSNVPVVYTLHDPLPPENTYEYEEFLRFASHNYVSISNSFRQSQLKINFVDTVYHGIDTTAYPLNETPDDYVLFLGRLVPEKGLKHALEAVKISGDKLVVSTNFPKPGERNSYFDQLAKEVQNPLVTNIGVMDKPRRIDLYRRAKALLFPIEWEEPFGIVLIEAMACGTPVIAYNRGSVPEIIKDGETGFIVNQHAQAIDNNRYAVKKFGIDGLVEAIKNIEKIQRVNCRVHVTNIFSVEKMVLKYIEVYEKIQKI